MLASTCTRMCVSEKDRAGYGGTGQTAHAHAVCGCWDLDGMLDTLYPRHVHCHSGGSSFGVPVPYFILVVVLSYLQYIGTALSLLYRMLCHIYFTIPVPVYIIYVILLLRNVKA